MPIFKSFRIKRLLQHIEKIAASNPVEKAPNLESAKYIGIVLNATQPELEQFAIQYAAIQEVENKKVEILGYLPKLEKYKIPEVNTFNNKDLNWMFQPVSQNAIDFAEQPFDLLINLSPEKWMPLEYICSVSKARFKIGNGTNHLQDYYDCLIELSDAKSPQDLIENMHYYLGNF